MNVSDEITLTEAKARATAQAMRWGGLGTESDLFERAKASTLSYARSVDDWDLIQEFFGELAKHRTPLTPIANDALPPIKSLRGIFKRSEP